MKRDKLNPERLKKLLNKYQCEVISKDNNNIVIKFRNYAAVPLSESQAKTECQ